MIAAARKRLPDIRFDIADVQTWSDEGPFDVILSNAVFQWVPNHDTLFPRFVARLNAGGSLAIQVPDNADEPAQRLMREMTTQGPWAAKLATAQRTERQGARWYYDLLRPLCSRVDLWRTIYYHVIGGGAAGVVEWFKGRACGLCSRASTPRSRKPFSSATPPTSKRPIRRLPTAACCCRSRGCFLSRRDSAQLRRQHVFASAARA
jgi:trans-aconitate 2-methyltransferase